MESQQVDATISPVDESFEVEKATLEPRIVTYRDGRHSGPVRWAGKVAQAELDEQFLSIHASTGSRRLLHLFGSRKPLVEVPLTEILGAERTKPPSSLASLVCGCSQGSFVAVNTIRRKGAAKEWVPHALHFCCESDAEADEWVSIVNAALARQSHRPQLLLVFINPFGGTKQAQKIWVEEAAPLLEKARIRWHDVETEKQFHAYNRVMQLTERELLSYDGIIAVGGDGLFQEVLTGLVKLQHSAERPVAVAAQRLRLGHIPAGSTDAVTYTVNGTRSAATAALHIALGDSMALDVMEIGTDAGEQKFAVCLASYGFMGDLMRKSEGMRWLGPARYDLAGALTFLKGKTYRTRISYSPASASLDSQTPCSPVLRAPEAPASPSSDSRDPSSWGWGSLVGLAQREQLPGSCREAAALRSGAVQVQVPVGEGADGGLLRPAERQQQEMGWASPRSEPGLSIFQDCTASECVSPSAGSVTLDVPALAADSWTGGQERVWEGDVAQVMCAVTPCRSDRSKQGVVPHAQMADGRLHLIVVQKTSRLNFLRFLTALSRKGVDSTFSFVRTWDVTAFKVEPIGEESCWNIDGELLGSNRIKARVHQGLVQVFARGVEPAGAGAGATAEANSCWPSQADTESPMVARAALREPAPPPASIVSSDHSSTYLLRSPRHATLSTACSSPLHGAPPAW